MYMWQETGEIKFSENGVPLLIVLTRSPKWRIIVECNSPEPKLSRQVCLCSRATIIKP